MSDSDRDITIDDLAYSIPAEMWRDCFGEDIYTPQVVERMIGAGYPSEPDWAEKSDERRTP